MKRPIFVALGAALLALSCRPPARVAGPPAVTTAEPAIELALPHLSPLPIEPAMLEARCGDRPIIEVIDALGRHENIPIGQMKRCPRALIPLLEATWTSFDSDRGLAIQALEAQDGEDSWHPLILLLENRTICEGFSISEFSSCARQVTEVLGRLTHHPPMARMISVAIEQTDPFVRTLFYRRIGFSGDSFILPRLRAAAALEARRGADSRPGQSVAEDMNVPLHWARLAMVKLGDAVARERLLRTGLKEEDLNDLFYLGDRRLARLLLPWLASKGSRQAMFDPVHDTDTYTVYFRDEAAELAHRLGVEFPLPPPVGWTRPGPFSDEVIAGARAAIEALSP